MTIDLSKLRGIHIYLELLLPDHREIIRRLARNEIIWEFNKMLLIDENYDKMFDAYFDMALDKEVMGGQQSFVIRQVNDDAVIGMTRLYEISERDKLATIGYTCIFLPYGEKFITKNASCCYCNIFLKHGNLIVQN